MSLIQALKSANEKDGAAGADVSHVRQGSGEASATAEM